MERGTQSRKEKLGCPDGDLLDCPLHLAYHSACKMVVQMDVGMGGCSVVYLAGLAVE